jgi:Flp pilus assembly protein TadG
VKSPLHRRLREDSRGQALVEFALVIPILMLLLLGIVDFARAWNVYEVLTDAGREATRLAVVDNGSTAAEVREVVKQAAARAGVAVADGDIAIAEGAARGEPTTVTISYGHTLRWVGGLLGLVGADRTIDFTIASTMRRE